MQKQKSSRSYVVTVTSISKSIDSYKQNIRIHSKTDYSHSKTSNQIMLLLAIGDLHIPDRAIDFPHEFKKLLVPGKIQQVLCLGNVTSSLQTLKFLNSLSPDLQIVKGAYDFDIKLPISSVVQHHQLKIGFLNGFTVVPKNDPLSLLTEARKMDADILIWGGTHRVEAYTLDNKLFINPGSATGALTTEELSDDEEDDLEEGEEEEEEQGLQKEGNVEVGQQQQQQGGEKEDEETDGQSNNNDNNAKAKTVNGDEKVIDGDNSSTKDSNDSEGELKKKNLLENIGIDEDEDGDNDVAKADPIPSFCLLDVQGSVCTLYIYTYLDDEVKVDKVTYRKE